MYLNWDFAIAMLPLIIVMGICWGIGEKLDEVARGRRSFRVASATFNGMAAVLLTILILAMAWQFIGPLVALFL